MARAASWTSWSPWISVYGSPAAASRASSSTATTRLFRTFAGAPPSVTINIRSRAASTGPESSAAAVRHSLQVLLNNLPHGIAKR